MGEETLQETQRSKELDAFDDLDQYNGEKMKNLTSKLLDLENFVKNRDGQILNLEK